MSRPIVLVVDDEEDIRVSLAQYLRRCIPEIGVVAARNGREALQLLRLTHVDVILADHYMPEMGGQELLREAQELYPNASRILMTAFPETEVLMEAVNETGVDHFFSKPLDPPEVAAMVSACLEENGAFEAAKRRHDTPRYLQAFMDS